MANKDKITPEILHELLNYNPLTGQIKFKPRSDKWFSSASSAKMWNGKNAGKRAFCKKSRYGYLVGRILNVDIAAHSVVWAMHYGNWPIGVIDHINGERTDNRIINLRDVTYTENQRNVRIRSDNKSGCHGVAWNEASKKWRTRIKVSGKYVQIDRDWETV